MAAVVILSAVASGSMMADSTFTGGRAWAPSKDALARAFDATPAPNPLASISPEYGGGGATAEACGGPFQRACCFLENIDIGACAPGNLEVSGCTGNCQCGGLAADGVNASSTCYPKTCGGDGQRACALDERSVGHPGACDLGLLEIPGCSGDCQGFGANHYASSSMCIGNVNQRIAEPTTNRASVAPPDACAVSGYADLHLHLFADTAHGGGILAGEPYDPNGGGVNVALQQDYGTTKDLVDFNGVDQAAMNASICPYGLNNCGTNFFHKDHLLDDPVGSVGTNDAAGSNLGAPIFNGWPRWTSTTHQQAYFQWLKRAYEGGMRLTTMLAVTNSALCKGNKRLRGFNCDDSMHEIDNQIDAAKRFETWINDNDGGWFKIVYSPVEARSAIANGKLAVVLGIEVDNLFNCSFPTQQVQQVGGIVTSWNFNTDNLNANCNPVALGQKLDHYYDLGIRHVFPIHNFDNGYGS
ncbi:MAG: hypothetical protein LAO77_26280, partial [Acidobacteriia bacterium]|nr:hypothetical protein [Terriglobia bacterium]